MRTYLQVLLILTTGLLSGCKTSPRTAGEIASGYTYVPVDPFSVQIVTNVEGSASGRKDGPPLASGTNAPSVAPGTKDGPPPAPAINAPGAAPAINAPGAAPGINAAASSPTITSFLESLPDNTVRISVETLDASGSVAYGPAAVSVKGARYKVTVDYINADTATIRLYLARSVLVAEPKSVWQDITYFLWGRSSAKGEERWIPINSPLPRGTVPGSERYFVQRVDTKEVDWDRIVASETTGVTKTNVDQVKAVGDAFNIPVYIGIGLRVTANIASYEANINISGMGNIGAAADAKKLSGSLVAQTLGINGKEISAALPIQSDLNQSTIQNAIVSIASIRTHLYDPDTVIVPRVVGLYLPFSGGKPLVNGIISELSKEPVKWRVFGPKTFADQGKGGTKEAGHLIADRN